MCNDSSDFSNHQVYPFENVNHHQTLSPMALTAQVGVSSCTMKNKPVISNVKFRTGSLGRHKPDIRIQSNEASVRSPTQPST